MFYWVLVVHHTSTKDRSNKYVLREEAASNSVQASALLSCLHSFATETSGRRLARKR